MLLHSWRHECYAFASESPASKMVFEVCHKKEEKGVGMTKIPADGNFGDFFHSEKICT